jgi:transcriptional regulator with XRE-family HTH domain
MSSFSTRLAAARAARQLTQVELARRAGLTSKGISMIESGKRPSPSVDTVCALAKAMGLTDAECGQLVCPDLPRAA